MNRFKICLLSAGVFVTLVSTLWAASKGSVHEFDGAQDASAGCETSTAFVDMPGMSVDFTIPTTDNVVVMFSAVLGQGSGASPGRAHLRLLIDGVPTLAGEVDAHQGDEAAANAFNFISGSLEKGPHTAVIQWRSASGGQICFDERSLIVLHK